MFVFYVVMIGVIGQGYVWYHLANLLEENWKEVVRCSLEEPYVFNKEKLQLCDVVFIAVPTPNKNGKFDDSILLQALSLVRQDAIIIIRSTLSLGWCDIFQEKNPNRKIIYMPEFLRSEKAEFDTRNPERIIFWIPEKSIVNQDDKIFQDITSWYPQDTPFFIFTAIEAEIIKMMSNAFLYQKVCFFNTVFDVSQKYGADFDKIRHGITLDSRIQESHSFVEGNSRWAWWHCFIKDYETLLWSNIDGEARAMLESIRDYNISLLINTKKDISIVKWIYMHYVD